MTKDAYVAAANIICGAIENEIDEWGGLVEQLDDMWEGFSAMDADGQYAVTEQVRDALIFALKTFRGGFGV